MIQLETKIEYKTLHSAGSDVLKAISSEKVELRCNSDSESCRGKKDL